MFLGAMPPANPCQMIPHGWHVFYLINCNMASAYLIHKKLQELCKDKHDKLCWVPVGALEQAMQIDKETLMAQLEHLIAMGYIAMDGNDVTVTEAGLSANLPH
jgi:hypothetical protein